MQRPPSILWFGESCLSMVVFPSTENVRTLIYVPAYLVVS